MVQSFIEDPPWIKHAARSMIDYIGFGLMAVWLATAQIVLDKGQQEDWFASSFIVWFTIISFVTLAAFITWELRAKHPIVSLRVLANRNFAVGTILITVVGVVLYGSTALLPLFLQTVMGYPALESGMAVSPRGIGSMLSMIVVARLIGKLDARLLIASGFLVLGLSVWWLGGITLEISKSYVVWPNIISGFAMGFIFVPLTTLTTGTLRNEEIGNATGIYNLMRNIGGGIGISAVTTMLARSAQIHQASMVSHLTPYDPAFQQRLEQLRSALATQMSPWAAEQQAYAIIYGTLVRQASALSFIDTFRLLGLLCLLCVLLVFFFKRVKARGGPAAMH